MTAQTRGTSPRRVPLGKRERHGMVRIAIAGLVHETNTFALAPTTLADFDMHGSSLPVLRGEEILTAFPEGGGAIGGLVRALHSAEAECVPLLWAAAQPGGIVSRDTFENLVGEILSGLAKATPVDAVLLDLHGAMVVAGIDDAEGELLERIREIVGNETFVSAVLDLHGNVSSRMVGQSDLLLPYKTYPHTDMEESGVRLAEETLFWLSQAARPAKAFRQIPYLIPIHAQCTLAQPMLSIFEALRQADELHDSNTGFLAGFPPADVHDCGPSILSYATDQHCADAALALVMDAVEAAEPAFAEIGLREGPDAVAEALGRAQQAFRPVIIVDTQDNPGAGATSDMMGLVTELLRQEARDAVVAVVHDPAVAAAAHEAGIGATLPLALGGKSGVAGAEPLTALFDVESLGDGRFVGTGAYYNGAELNFGPMALLRVRDTGVRVVVGSQRAQAGTQAILRHLGLDPAAIGILGLKSSVHFLADFATLTADVVYAAFPGLNTADPAAIPYTKLRSSIRKNPSPDGQVRAYNKSGGISMVPLFATRQR